MEARHLVGGCKFQMYLVSFSINLSMIVFPEIIASNYERRMLSTGRRFERANVYRGRFFKCQITPWIGFYERPGFY